MPNYKTSQLGKRRKLCGLSIWSDSLVDSALDFDFDVRGTITTYQMDNETK